MNLESDFEDGWDGGYYNVFSPKGIQLYGGSLQKGKVVAHKFCLPAGGCSTIMMGLRGEICMR